MEAVFSSIGVVCSFLDSIFINFTGKSLLLSIPAALVLGY